MPRKGGTVANLNRNYRAAPKRFAPHDVFLGNDFTEVASEAAGTAAAGSAVR